MKSKRKYTHKAILGESLSSWMHRHDRNSIIRSAPNISASASSCYKKFIAIKSQVISVDRDFKDSNDVLLEFLICHRVDVTSLGTLGDPEERPIVPFHYRRSYCYECFESSLQLIQSFAWKLEWRYMLNPFCSVHDTLLREAPLDLALSYGFGQRAFESHHGRGRHQARHDAMCIKSADIFNLSWIVQVRYEKLRKLAAKRGESKNLDEYVLSIVRSMLMPCMRSSFDDIDLNGVLGPDCFPRDGHSLYIQYFYEIYRVTSAARARALYLMGILLGWIDEKQAIKSQGDNYFIATCPDDIFNHLRKSKALTRLLCQKLKNHQNDYMSIDFSSIAGV